MRGYVICATPRSGSTLLCSLLRSTGVAGWPESWFRSQNRADWAQDWQVACRHGKPDWPAYLNAAKHAATGPNGILSLRMMWENLAELITDLGGAAPANQAALLARTFGPLRFIHLSRQDKLAQAISRHKAEVSGTWHIGFEEATHPATPRYDAVAIQGHLDAATADDAAWTDWFAANHITPHTLSYETLAADPITASRGVLAFLDLPDAPTPQTRNQRMADATSADWATRFRAEPARPRPPS